MCKKCTFKVNHITTIGDKNKGCRPVTCRPQHFFLCLYVLHYGTKKGSALILETVLYSQRGGANEFS